MTYLPPPLHNEQTLVQRDRELYADASKKNIERYVGTARVPVGLAGPLRIRGQHIDGEVHVPLATTEGTLVASTTRGMKVLDLAGGVETRVTRRATIQRAPVFLFGSVASAARFADELGQDWRWLDAVVDGASRHAALDDVSCFVQGRAVHVRISIAPGDAAGQNMVSVVAGACVERLAERADGVERIWLEGGFSGEKVPAPLNRLLGRGRGAVASATIEGDVLRRVTRAEPRDIATLFSVYVNAGSWAGYANTHASLINVLPAIFIATGQDVASVPESCVGQNQLDYDPERDLLRWEVVCPNLVIGSVGGGTHLPTQRELLQVLGCTGDGGADRLAEICAATALANEVSFWSAIAANEWVDAHAALRHR